MLSLGRGTTVEMGLKITRITGVPLSSLACPQQQCIPRCERGQVPELGVSELLTRSPKPSPWRGLWGSSQSLRTGGWSKQKPHNHRHQGRCWGRLERGTPTAGKEPCAHCLSLTPITSRGAWIP